MKHSADRAETARTESLSTRIARSGRASVSLLLSCAIVANGGCSGSSPLRGSLNSPPSGGQPTSGAAASADSTTARPATGMDVELARSESEGDDSRARYAPTTVSGTTAGAPSSNTAPSAMPVAPGASRSTVSRRISRDELAADMPAGGQAQGAPPPNNREQSAQEAQQQTQQPTQPRTNTWQQATAPEQALRLAIGDRETLPLRGLQVRAQVDGFRARIVMDAYFFNDRGRQYEGTFQLKLPEGASPYFFAFGESAYATQDARQVAIPFFPAPSAQGLGLSPDDILRARAHMWNAPREARVVPRERAAHAYNETVRARVDPALMEWSGAGVFEARVFPLVNEKLHRIVVAYDVTLDRDGEEYVLPLNLPRETNDVILDVAVAQSPGGTVAIAPATRPRVDGGYSFYRFERPQQRAIQLRLRGPSPTLVGSDGSPDAFFASHVTATIPETQAQSSPENAVFLVDTSLSDRPENFARWLRVLERVLDSNRDSMRRFAVQFFDVTPRWWRGGFIENTPENVRALMSFANELSLQGATDLGAALHEASSPAFAQGPSDRWDTFLLSDAAATWGEGDVRRIAADYDRTQRGRIFAYRLATTGGGDGATMAQLVRHSGGAVFTIANDEDLARAAIAHRNTPWQLRSATVEGATDVVLAGAPSALFPGQRLAVVGKGRLAANARLHLEMFRGSATTSVDLPLGPQLSSSLAPRVFGETAVALLEDKAPVTDRQARAFATHFRVTGRSCSMVMLESEADYQRFGIVPNNEAQVVRETNLRTLVTSAEREAAATVSDARGAFLAWMDRLPTTPGVTIRISPELRSFVQQLPATAFDLPRENVVIERVRRSDVSAGLQSALTQDELDYDAVSNEANALRQSNRRGEALRALSSLIEKRPGDTVLARDVAFTTSEWGLPVSAYHLLRRVQSLRPSESHTYRSIAETLAAMGRNDLALALYEIAINSEWDQRSRDYRAIAGVGYLRFLREIARGTRPIADRNFAAQRLGVVRDMLPTLSQAGQMPIPVRSDILVMIAWSTDNTDVDLHVVDPAGEECYYGHRQTAAGGYLTQDVTTGYGPEMFIQPQARVGQYRVFAHFFGSNRNRASARTRVLATVVRRWGSANEEVTTRAITLGDTGDRQNIELVNWSQ